MVRAAIASFGVPFILGLGTLAVYRNTKDLFLPLETAAGESSADSASPAAKPAEPAPAPAPPEERPSLDELARRRAEQLKQEQMQALETEATVREWLTALAEKRHEAATAENQQALAAAAGQFAGVFLTKAPKEAAIADLRPELDYDVLDKCLAALAALPESSLRQDLDAYIRSRVVKLAEVFEMQVDREKVAHLATAAAEAVSGSGDN